MPHREVIATSFRIGALLLGLPSVAAFAILSFGAVRLHVLGTHSVATGKSGDQLIDLLVSGAMIFGKLFELFGGAVKLLLVALSVVSLACVVFAVLLFFTGRGLHASRGWARILGILLAMLPLLISFIAMTTLRRPVQFAISGATLALSLYVIWALSLRFVD